MAISRVGANAAEATTVTIPSGHQNGDLLIMFAFQDGTVTNPTVPAGWTILSDTLDGTLCSVSLAWRVATSGSVTSGTWTGATGLLCVAYRGTATNKAPLGPSGPSNAYFNSAVGTTSPISFGVLAGVGRSSWVVSFFAHRSTNVSQGIPSGLSNVFTLTGTLVKMVACDSAAPLTQDGWPLTTVAITGTASGWITCNLEIEADEGRMQNFMAPKSGSAASGSDNPGVLGFGERIR